MPTIMGSNSAKCDESQMPMELWDLAGGVICSFWSRSCGEGFKELSLERCMGVFQKDERTG